MKFSQTDSTASQSNLCYAFQLSPMAFAIHPPQSCNITNPGADSYGFDLSNFAEDFKVHQQRI